jgi:6-phosphogluconate dehydrogenase
MEVGMVGLGRMGSNLVRRLLKAGHPCVVYDLHPEAVQAVVSEGAVGATTLNDLVARLSRPRVLWMMVPAAAVEQTLEALVPLLQHDDVVVDGGNSFYHDDLRRAAELQTQGIHYLDVGTSGGIWGLERGYCLMIGGEETAVQRLDPIFAALAPGIARPRARPDGNPSAARPNEVICTADRPAQATSSRWCTMGSSTVSWPRMRRG